MSERVLRSNSPSTTNTASNGSDNLLTALVSGCVAAAATGTLLYPLDFIKTQQQLNDLTYMKKWKIEGNYPSTLGQMSKGCSALVLGAVFKNSTRLIAYNWLSNFMAVDTHDNTKKTSAPRLVIAGVMSAFAETLWLIPFENIKIRMVQNQSLVNEFKRNKELVSIVPSGNQSNKPKNIFYKQYVSPHQYFTGDVIDQYKGGEPPSKFKPYKPTPIDKLKVHYNKHPSLTLLGTIKEMHQLQGIRAFTSGTLITFARQIGVSWVWLSTYNATRQLIDPHNKEPSWFGHKHTAIQLTGLHLISSLAVIAVTQPLDVIKSHMQLKNGKQLSNDSLRTAYRLVLQEGPTVLFKGALPRGLKVLLSGGLTASIYGKVEEIVGVAIDQKMFDDRLA